MECRSTVDNSCCAASKEGARPMMDALVKRVGDALTEVGEMTLFALRVLLGIPLRAGRGTYLGIFYGIGIDSIPVIAITGLFIGMVLAVQAYGQYAQFGLATRLGSIINVSVIRELGPVLAATMLAGRVGCAMAAELATMRITEQVDALACLGVDPVKHLGTPRLVASVLLIPLLTIVANFMGVVGGAIICTWVYRIESYYYWQNTQGYIDVWDLTTGLIKPIVFGAAIALVSCQRGLNSEPGAEGVGRAATRAFVASFIAILVLDFFLAMFLNEVHEVLWPRNWGLV
jgi:phospholipid/cholesterol/gamma-HCH transport system permease protein